MSSASCMALRKIVINKNYITFCTTFYSVPLYAVFSHLKNYAAQQLLQLLAVIVCSHSVKLGQPYFAHTGSKVAEPHFYAVQTSVKKTDAIDYIFLG
jgi:hypothetical protein